MYCVDLESCDTHERVYFVCVCVCVGTSHRSSYSDLWMVEKATQTAIRCSMPWGCLK